MFLSVSLCVLTVSAVWAQGGMMMNMMKPMSGMMMMDNMTMCQCMPDKYTALAMELSAFLPQGSMDPIIMDGTYTMDVSFSMQKTRMVGMRRDQTTSMMKNVTMYLDYKMGKYYTVDEMGMCHEQSLPNDVHLNKCAGMMNHTYMGSYMLGPGMNALTVNVLSGPTMNGMGWEYMHMVDCSLVAYSTYGEMMVDTTVLSDVQSWVYANYKPDMWSETDPFMMPDACKMSAVPVGKRSVEAQALVEKFGRIPIPSFY